MGLVNASLIVGGLLAAVPIALHLLMRPKPQSMVFPAVRFVLNRRESNVRKLQLRHWLLLALRCLIIVLLALSLALSVRGVDLLVLSLHWCVEGKLTIPLG